MRLAYIAQSTVPSRTANSIHVMKMAQAFAAHDHEVTLIVPATDNTEPDSDDLFRYYHVDKVFEIARTASFKMGDTECLFGPLAAFKAKSTLPKLVYTRDLLAAYMSAVLGMPVIYEAHAPILPDGSVKAKIFARLIKRPHLLRLVVISEALKQMVLDDYPQLAPKLKVAHDGADPLKVEPGQTSPIESFRGESDGDEVDFRLQVGYVGNLYKGRGIEVIAEIARECEFADVHIVGGSEDDVAEWRAKLAHIENLHIHGFMPPARAELYRQGCDVLLAPYQRTLEVPGGMDTAKWMSPLKIFEYMAAGKAIICSDLNVLKEVLTNRENAILCPPDEPKSWSAALEELNKNTQLRQQLGKQANLDFRRLYTWESRAKSVLQGL